MFYKLLILNVIFLGSLFLTSGNTTCERETSGQESSLKSAPCKNAPYQSGLDEGKSPLELKMSAFSTDSRNLQEAAREALKNTFQNKSFQEFISELQQPSGKGCLSEKTLSKEGVSQKCLPDPWFKGLPSKNQESQLYIFVSFSMGEKALLNLAQEAHAYGATLVLRGFKDNSYVKTAKALEKIILKAEQGVIIDPELYTLFSITAVPTFILSKSFQFNASERNQTPLHDKLQGHVSLKYALEIFAKAGDLKEEAQALLERGFPR